MALCFLYFELVMTCWYILKPVRESFFLGELGISRLPFAHLTVMVATLVAVQVYVFLAARWTRRRLVLGANLFFVSSILVFWALLGPGGAGEELRRGLAWVYYVWVSLFSVFVVTLFWSLTHSLFLPGEGNRYYGVIGAGGILGAMCGGFLTTVLAGRIGTIQLLAVAAGVLALTLPIGLRLAREEPPAEAHPGTEPGSGDTTPRRGGAGPSAGGGAAPGGEEASARSAGEPHSASPRSPYAMLARDAYLTGIAWLIFLSVLMAVLDDYRFKQVILGAYPEQDPRTAFLGSIYFATNVLGLMISLLVTGPVQARWGPRPGMLLYPLVFMTGSVAMLVAGPSIDLVFLIVVLEQSVAYSIYQASRELLYLPTPRDVKFLVKGVIDTFVFRLGTGVASLGILLAWPADGVRSVSWVILGIAAGLVLLALALSREHARRVERLPVGKPAGGAARA